MTRFLDKIDSPQDLKKLKLADMPQLAQEIRERLLDAISKTGGHLGSNLGIVETTLAMHYVFDSPRDKFVWDVGHQSYVHKLLTGRRDRFHTVRQYEGLCGFSRREESEYDHWNTGHGGTSISGALAFAQGRDLKKEDFKVVAVIGDGSLTAGMAFEGLNHAGHIKTDIIIVLNDNEMSIAPNVGGLSAHLSQIMTGQVITKFKREIDSLLLSIPGIGKEISMYAHKLDEAIKGVFIPGRLFEDLGLRYVGPVDGHDVDEMVETFESIKDLKGPTLLHVITQKGRGYRVAEEKADIWHGASPFDIKTGQFIKKPSNPAYTTIFADALIELAKQDEKIVGITAAMPDGTGITKFGQVFPERTFDVGMAEQHAVAFAGGLAIEGFHPVAAIYSTFLQRAYDQVVHDICLMNLPVTFAMDRAGLVGEDGATHQGLYDIAYLRALPNMVVMAPKDENELRHMLKTCIYHPGPAAMRYPRGSALGVTMDAEMKIMEIGKGEVLRDGDQIAILAYGHMVPVSMEVAQRLEQLGLSVAVINGRFAKPVDAELVLQYAKQCKCLITVEEHALCGGWGSAVLEVLEERDALDGVHMKRIGVEDRVIHHGAVGLVRKELKLDVDGIFDTIHAFYQSIVGEDSASGKKKDENPQGSSRGGKDAAYGGIAKKDLKIKQTVNG